MSPRRKTEKETAARSLMVVVEVSIIAGGICVPGVGVGGVCVGGGFLAG